MSGADRHDDLRQVDGHESWRGVCHQLGVDPDQHESAMPTEVVNDS